MQFPDDPRRTPGGIRLPHRLDEFADLLGNDRETGGSMLTHAPPVVSKALLLPGDDRPGLDERQDRLPARPEPREPRPEQAVGRMKTRAMSSLLINRQLVPQCQVFQAQ